MSRSQLNSCFKKGTHCQSFMVLGASDMSAADWLSQTHMKNCYCNNYFCSRVEILVS